jgi:hypothetical protein
MRKADHQQSRPVRRNRERDGVKPGDEVTIHSLGGNFPRIEGRATVIARGPLPDSFYVRFENEKVIRPRVILPRLYQRRPQAVTKAQLARWRAISNSLRTAEFFLGWT